MPLLNAMHAIGGLMVFVVLPGPFADSGGPEAASTSNLDEHTFHVLDTQSGEFIETLLEENPQLDSAWARSRSYFERVPQARSLPDLQLSYRYFARTPETRVGPQDHQFELSQGLPWGKKRGLQAGRAEYQASGTTWEAEDLGRRLVAELKRVYFDAAYLQEALTVNSEEQALLRRFESISLRRYATGEGIQQSAIKVQTDITRLDERKTALRERLDIVIRRIAELIGQPEAPLTLEPIALPLPAIDYDRAELERFATAGHPRVFAIEQRIEADRVWSKRQKLESRPDFKVGVGYIFVGDREDAAGVALPPEDNGKDVLSFNVGINIPVYRQRIRSGVAEALASEQSNRDLLGAVRDRQRFDVQQSLVRLDSLNERSRLFHEVIIPQAEESLASAEAAYATDNLGFLDLLDAERILFQSRLSYHRLVADLWIALADLELAIARPFPPSGSS